MTNFPHFAKLLGLVFSVAVLVAWGCRPGTGDPPEGPALTLSLAVRSAPYSGLIAIADEKGYFKEAGLDVTLKLYPSGKAALEAVCGGDAQVATVADIAFAAKALEDPSVRVLASIGTTVGDQIVARKDRNIQNPGDLRGKKVGVTADTTSDYFLYTFLVIENIPQEDVTIVDIPAARKVEALINGDVDAVAAFEVFAVEAKQRLGDNAVFWDSQNNLAYHWLLATGKEFTDRPEPLRRLLRALIKAESFARDDEEEAKRIISGKWGFELSPTKTRLNVSFGQSVVTSLQNYTRWHLTKAGNRTEPPNILNYLQTGILDEVAPGTVTIFR
jgi:ABC-type nitrate/sulfonate/bicarbonate transport system substrate-binding protein